jgi:hypothetical protein
MDDHGPFTEVSLAIRPLSRRAHFVRDEEAAGSTHRDESAGRTAAKYNRASSWPTYVQTRKAA